MMDILSILTVVYLTVIGVLFVRLGSNHQSRFFGILTLTLAGANGLKLAGLI